MTRIIREVRRCGIKIKRIIVSTWISTTIEAISVNKVRTTPRTSRTRAMREFVCPSAFETRIKPVCRHEKESKYRGVEKKNYIEKRKSKIIFGFYDFLIFFLYLFYLFITHLSLRIE